MYATQYYNNKPTLALADNVAVTAGATTSGINATLAVAGHVTGTVTKAGGAGLGNIHVNAYRSDGSGGWEPVDITGARTAADGTYDLGRLPTGSYRIGFQDDAGVYAAQYYNNKPTLATADNVAVTVGVTTPNINATLVTPTLTVRAPNGGESYAAGSAQTVSWTVSPAHSSGLYAVWAVSAGTPTPGSGAATRSPRRPPTRCPGRSPCRPAPTACASPTRCPEHLDGDGLE